MKIGLISKYPVHNQHPTPLLFSHGAMRTAPCWDAHFLDYLAQHGYVAHAINLRAHGNNDGRADPAVAERGSPSGRDLCW